MMYIILETTLTNIQLLVKYNRVINSVIGIALFSERREEPHHPMFLRTCWVVPPVNPLIEDFKETVYDQIVSAAHEQEYIEE